MIAPDTLLQNRYLVKQQIGKGGMGVVYMAIDQRFGSTVALKEIKETVVDKPHLLKAFEREARLLNHLRHNALPRVSDHFTEADGQFLVMEFIPGADLSEMLKERGVPFSRVKVLEWADQLLDALDYLHTHEPPVIHRDIKPQNLKLTARDRVMLLDFGLAKGAPLHASQVSQTGSLFGYSFNYAPLEQMQGTGTDPRSDLYSLGATLYHLMTNTTPPDALTRATAVLSGQPDPLRPANEIQAQVTVPVARVLANAMAQNAAQRPQTAGEMREALRAAGLEVNAANRHTTPAPIVEGQAQKQDKSPAAKAEPHAAGAATIESRKSADGGSHYDLTVIEPAPPKHGLPPSTRNRDDGSIVTKLRPHQPAAPERQKPNRAFSIVLSVVLFAIVAAVVYTFTRSPSTQPISSPGDAAAPSPTAPANVETQAPAAPSQPLVQPSPETSNPPSSSSQSQPAAVQPNPQPAAADNNPAAAQPSPQGTSGGPGSTAPALTPEEERARKADEIRRERREKDEQDMKRQREALEEEQRRERERIYMERERQLQPRQPPPGGPPPPRRDGPPPPY
jgi:serine/threonine protein kinase